MFFLLFVVLVVTAIPIVMVALPFFLYVMPFLLVCFVICAFADWVRHRAKIDQESVKILS